MPVEASKENRVQLARGFHITGIDKHVIQLVRVFARNVTKRYTRKSGRELNGEYRARICHRNTKKSISRMLAPRSRRAVGI